MNALAVNSRRSRSIRTHLAHPKFENGGAPGLYRYRLGDVIRVKSFRKTAPVYEFVRRKNVILSVHTDKTDEEELQGVVNKAAELLKGTAMELTDYTSTADITSLPGRYRIFWEMTETR